MNKVQPAQRVRVGVEAKNGQILQFFSYVKSVSNDRLLLIYPQSKANFAQFLKEGTTVRLSVYTPLGILLLNSIVINAPVNCEFEVEYEMTQKRIQRRKYVRAQASYRMIIEQMNKTYTVLTEDIGGGGVRFICDEYLHPSAINAKLFIPELQKGIPFTGNIEKKERFKPNEYLIQFVEISEADRNKIIQKCLEIEAEKIRQN